MQSLNSSIVALEVTHLEDALCASRHLDETLALRHRRGQRLLDQDVRAGFEKIFRYRVVQRRRRHDADGIDAAQQIVVIGVARDAQFERQLRCAPRPRDRRFQPAPNWANLDISAHGIGQDSQLRLRQCALGGRISRRHLLRGAVVLTHLQGGAADDRQRRAGEEKNPRQTVQNPADIDHNIMPTPKITPMPMSAQGLAS